MKLGELRNILNNMVEGGLSEDMNIHLQGDPEGNFYHTMQGVEVCGLRPEEAEKGRIEHAYGPAEIEEDYPDDTFVDILVIYP